MLADKWIQAAKLTVGSVVLLIVFLLGCNVLSPAPTATLASTPRPLTLTSSSLPPAMTMMPMPTPTPLPVASTVAPSPHPPTVTPTPAQVSVCALSPRAAITASEPIHNVILFVSTIDKLVQSGGGHLAAPVAGGRISVPQLWAVSADGQRAGRLTNDVGGIAFFTLSVTVPNLTFLSATRLSLDDKRIKPIPLPSECEPPATTPTVGAWQPCSNFQFSPDRRWAAFLWGPEVCGRSLAVKNLDMGQVQTAPGGAKAGVHWFQLFDNDQLLVTTGHCEGGMVSWVNLQTGERRSLGAEGAMHWNASGDAFAVSASDYPGSVLAVWGYDVVQGQMFLREEWQVNDQPLWTPDGAFLLYQHRARTQTKSATTFSPREIRIVDSASGQERVLVGDPQHDYHLCAGLRECRWEGDWVLVRRFPYHLLEYPNWPDSQNPTVECLMYGQKCPDPVERLALNWRTGELLPWDQSPRPTPTLTLTPTVALGASSRLASVPLYSDPAGRYKLYIDTNGRSLWCVPMGGAAVRWVPDGQSFIYIP